MRRIVRALHGWLTQNTTLLGGYASLASIVAAGVAIVTLPLICTQIREAFAEPEVGLGFYRAQAPQFRVINLGSTVVRDPKYQLVIYDFDVKADGKPMILIIPVRALDYLNPSDSHGPYGIVSLSQHPDVVKDGHHLFGYAQVTCPGCRPSFRRYWFYAELGKLGWYVEIPTKEHATINKRLADIVYSPNPLERIDVTIPSRLRIGF
jgi:hypothetical protein